MNLIVWLLDHLIAAVAASISLKKRWWTNKREARPFCKNCDMFTPPAKDLKLWDAMEISRLVSVCCRPNGRRPTRTWTWSQGRKVWSAKLASFSLETSLSDQRVRVSPVVVHCSGTVPRTVGYGNIWNRKTPVELSDNRQNCKSALVHGNLFGNLSDNGWRPDADRIFDIWHQ